MDPFDMTNTSTACYNCSSSTTPMTHHESSSGDFYWMRVLAIVVSATTVFVGGVGNLTVLAAFILCPQFMWSKQNIYLFCLTICDLISTTFISLQQLDQFLSGGWRHSRAWCRIFLTAGSLVFVCSMNFVALISRDRMLMVVKGGSYNTYESARRKWMLVLISVAGSLLVLFPYTNLDIFTNISLYHLTKHCGPEHFQSLYFTVVDQVVIALPQIGCMIFFYARVRKYVIARKLSKKNKKKKQGRTIRLQTIKVLPNNNNAPNTTITAHTTTTAKSSAIVLKINSRTLDSSRRVMLIMNVLVAAVCVTMLPLMILSIVMHVFITHPTLFSRQTMSLWSRMYGLSVLFGCIGYALNPILYSFAMPSYREAIRQVFRTICRRP